MTKLKEHPFEGILLVCDMDGTLLDCSGRVSIENKMALERFVQGGGLFTVATGRIGGTVLPYLADLPANVPAIVYNGAAIYDFKADRLLWQKNLSGDIRNVASGILESFPGIGMQLYYGGTIYIVGQSEETRAHMIREGFKPVFTSIDNVPGPWLKILMAWEPARLAEVEEYLKGIKGDFHTVYSEPQFLEVLGTGVSKGHALKELTAMLDRPPEYTVAMGDHMNDFDMLRVATVGIAVENAHASLKEAADRCCCTNDNHAVSEVIGWLGDGTIRF